MNNPFTLSSKTILATGASAGIGRGIAIAWAGMGAQVIRHLYFSAFLHKKNG